MTLLVLQVEVACLDFVPSSINAAEPYNNYFNDRKKI